MYQDAENQANLADARQKAPAISQSYSDALSKLSQGNPEGWQDIANTSQQAIGNPFLMQMTKDAQAQGASAYQHYLSEQAALQKYGIANQNDLMKFDQANYLKWQQDKQQEYMRWRTDDQNYQERLSVYNSLSPEAQKTFGPPTKPTPVRDIPEPMYMSDMFRASRGQPALAGARQDVLARYGQTGAQTGAALPTGKATGAVGGNLDLMQAFPTPLGAGGTQAQQNDVAAMQAEREAAEQGAQGTLPQYNPVTGEMLQPSDYEALQKLPQPGALPGAPGAVTPQAVTPQAGAPAPIPPPVTGPGSVAAAPPVVPAAAPAAVQQPQAAAAPAAAAPVLGQVNLPPPPGAQTPQGPAPYVTAGGTQIHPKSGDAVIPVGNFKLFVRGAFEPQEEMSMEYTGGSGIKGNIKKIPEPVGQEERWVVSAMEQLNAQSPQMTNAIHDTVVQHSRDGKPTEIAFVPVDKDNPDKTAYNVTVGGELVQGPNPASLKLKPDDQRKPGAPPQTIPIAIGHDVAQEFLKEHIENGRNWGNVQSIMANWQSGPDPRLRLDTGPTTDQLTMVRNNQRDLIRKLPPDQQADAIKKVNDGFIRSTWSIKPITMNDVTTPTAKGMSPEVYAELKSRNLTAGQLQSAGEAMSISDQINGINKKLADYEDQRKKADPNDIDELTRIQNDSADLIQNKFDLLNQQRAATQKIVQSWKKDPISLSDLIKKIIPEGRLPKDLQAKMDQANAAKAAQQGVQQGVPTAATQ
jgi:hypothetical protein